ncbi:hypothetical protein C7S18_20650 [Ahniella affigens]|uniref:OmpR/PhoB-type domain-containing protein n=1 Tax=Ahniella affigens TaxID=2021234 RepID=A0A2P1PX77_9GAMM|nr:winged helix-turn-helix domain-containing protein [Ahniella affigens]AVP99430.1 hypothetical protein C7S18_20650 [Ahniella affigens]
MRLHSHEIEFDVDTATLHGPNGSQPLRRQVAETLLVLMQRAPALVSVDTLLDTVWGRHAISPSAVPQTIRELRRALGDHAQDSIYIETRHKLGYRWIPPVQRLDGPDAAAAAEGAPGLAAEREMSPPTQALVALPPAARQQRRWPLWASAMLGAALLATALLFGWYSRGLWPLQRADTDRTGVMASADRTHWQAAMHAWQAQDLDSVRQALSALPQDELARSLLGLRLQAVTDSDASLPANIDAVRARLPEADQAGRLWAQAVLAHVAGQDTVAWSHLEPLLALRPDDVDLRLLAWDLRRRLPKDRIRQLSEYLSAAPGLPPARRELLAIQAAGEQKEPERRQQLAEAWLRVHAKTHPVLALTVLLEQAEALEALRQPSDARALALAVSATAEQLGAARLAARAMRTAVWNAMVQSQNDLAEADLARMQQLLQDRYDPSGAVSMRHFRAMLFNRRGDHDQAIDAFTQLAQDYEAMGELGSAASALNATVSPRYLLGRGDEVPATINTALDLATRANAIDTIGFLRGSLGNHYVRTGDLQQGQMYIGMALESFRQNGDRHAEAAALGNLGQVAQMRGRLQEAQRFNEQAAVLETALGNAHGLAYTNKRLMDIAIAQGDLTAASALGQSALQGFGDHGDHKEAALTARLLAELHLRQGQLDAALRLQETLAATADKSPLVRAEQHMLRGDLARYRGEFKQAAAEYTEAAAIWSGAEERSDALLARLCALRATLPIAPAVAIEEELRLLMTAPERSQNAAIDLNARLLLAEVLIWAARRDEATAALAELETALSQTVDAETSLRLALLRADLDTEPDSRQQRREWVAAQAQSKGMLLLALEAEGRMAEQTGAADWSAFVQRARAMGATGLIRRQRP